MTVETEQGEGANVVFTQYERPNGAQRPFSFWLMPETVAKASKIVEAGFALEMELLTTGEFSFTVGDTYLDEDAAILFCPPVNILETAARLIDEFDIEAKLAHRAGLAPAPKSFPARAPF